MAGDVSEKDIFNCSIKSAIDKFHFMSSAPCCEDNVVLANFGV